MIVISILTKRKDLALSLALLRYFPLWSLQRKWLSIRERDSWWQPGNVVALLQNPHCDAAEIITHSLFSALVWCWGRSVWHSQVFKAKDFLDWHFLFIYFQFSSDYVLDVLSGVVFFMMLFHPLSSVTFRISRICLCFMGYFDKDLPSHYYLLCPTCCALFLLRLRLSWVSALVVLSPAVVPLKKSVVVDL